MKFDNYMDPRKTFGKAVTQEAEKNEVHIGFAGFLYVFYATSHRKGANDFKVLA